MPNTAPPEGETAAPGTALEVAVPVGEVAGVVRGATPDEILAKAGTIAGALKRLIDEKGMSVSVGGTKKHVEVGAWQACGTMLGALGGQPLHAETVWTRRMVGDDGLLQRTRYTAEVKRYKGKGSARELVSTTTYDVDGFDWEAKVEIRTAAGDLAGSAEAMVSRAEDTWSRRDDYALRSMAETRAESRAYRRAIGWIIHLAGYNATPAEEMGHQPGADNDAAVRPHGPEAGDQLQATLLRALAFLLDTGDGPDGELAREAYGVFGEKLGYVPQAVAQAIVLTAKVLKDKVDPPSHPEQAAAETGEDEPQPAEVAQGGGPGEEAIADADVVPDDDPTAGPPPQATDEDAATQARADEAFQGGTE